MRPLGLSAFVRCQNEEEFIVASLLSVHRFVDEILVVLNNCSDRTPELVEDLARLHPKIRVATYTPKCHAVGRDYLAAVRQDPSGSLAAYYNFCMEQTTFSHLCKWDGDMIALPSFSRVREMSREHDVVCFDGCDVLGQPTTDLEPRVFRHDPKRACYQDWDLYEILVHDYSRVGVVTEKCYLHMKLVKRIWRERQWVNPNLQADRPVPPAGARSVVRQAWLSRWTRRVLAWCGGRST